MGQDAYLLGHGELEWSRLEEQHALWREGLLGALRCAGLGPGVRVLDVGCGAGDLLAELASEVGPRGSALGLEPDPAACAEARRRGLDVLSGGLESYEPPVLFDLVVARWVLWFLPDVAAAVARMASWLRPGGALVLQDYVHDGLHLYPEHPAVLRTIEAHRTRIRTAGGDLWVAGRLPQVLTGAGLEVEAFLPEVKAGPPGSPEHLWVERFLSEHLDGVVAEGFLEAEEAQAFRQAWRQIADTPGAWLITPLQITVVGRRA